MMEYDRHFRKANEALAGSGQIAGRPLSTDASPAYEDPLGQGALGRMSAYLTDTRARASQLASQAEGIADRLLGAQPVSPTEETRAARGSSQPAHGCVSEAFGVLDSVHGELTRFEHALDRLRSL